MAKTLLQLTQNILSDMDSDEVNSIYDTVEALQVATIICTTLEAEFTNVELPSFNKIGKLTSVSDLDYPNYLKYGEDISSIEWLRYRNNRNNNHYQEVRYLTPSQFFDRMTLMTNTGDNTRKISDPSGVDYYIKTNKCPNFYTSVDNETLIFDSFDSEFEDTLEASNSFVLIHSSFSDAQLLDEYVPPIPNNYFPLLLAESKANCFITLKQMAAPKQEQIARRQRSRIQNNVYKSRKADYPYARSKYNFARNR